MSTRSENIVQQLNDLEELIKSTSERGGDVMDLIERRRVLAEQLKQTLTALNESKVLKG